MPTTVNMSGKTCIVTGASSGIGLATAEELAAMGARVVLICRNRSRGKAALAQILDRASEAEVGLLIADLSSQAEVRRVAQEFLDGYDRLDVLVNNAGAVFTHRMETVDGIERTFATNHLACFLLTNLLLDRLKASAPARIVNVSSRAHERTHIRFDNIEFRRRYSAWRAYGQSKLANVMFTYELARRLRGTRVTANCLHPGVVRSNFGKNNRGIIGGAMRAVVGAAGVLMDSPEEGAETSVYLATSPDVEFVSGKYFDMGVEAPSSPQSYDEDVARRLWELSERMTGITEGATV